MKTYLTKEKGGLKMIVSYKTISKISRGSSFSLYKKGDPNDFKILHNAVFSNKQQTTTIKVDKTDIVQRSILKIVTVFHVDKTQLPNKQNILEDTETYYSLKGDISNPKEFTSTYGSTKNEFKDTGSNTFRITKSIEIKLVPNTVNTKNQLMQFLNSQP